MIDYTYENKYCVRDAFRRAGLPITKNMLIGDIDLDAVDSLLEHHGYTIFDKSTGNLHLLSEAVKNRYFFLQLGWGKGKAHLEYHLPNTSHNYNFRDVVGFAVLLD